jgi:TRAP-type C4-dicarboxylate transport system substrate-binding protein
MTTTARLTTTLALGALTALVPAGFAPAPAAAAEVDGPAVTWQVALWGNRRGFTEGVERLAAVAAEKTDGKFKLDLKYGGVLSEPGDTLDGLQLGAFEAGSVCSFYNPGKTPVSTALNLPLLPLPTLEAQHKTYDVVLKHPAIAAEWASWNAVPLMSILMPNYEVMGRGTPPTTVTDWQGRRINASGGHAALMTTMGAVPTTIPSPDIYSTMERGALDGVVYPYSYAFAVYNLHELSTWVSDGWNLGTVHCAFAVNGDAWNALPPQYRDLIEAAIPGAYEAQIADYARVDAENEAKFEARGLQRIAMGDDVRAALQAAVEPAWKTWVDDMTAKGQPGQEIIDLILSTAASVQN